MFLGAYMVWCNNWCKNNPSIFVYFSKVAQKLSDSTFWFYMYENERWFTFCSWTWTHVNKMRAVTHIHSPSTAMAGMVKPVQTITPPHTRSNTHLPEQHTHGKGWPFLGLITNIGFGNLGVMDNFSNPVIMSLALNSSTLFSTTLTVASSSSSFALGWFNTASNCVNFFSTASTAVANSFFKFGFFFFFFKGGTLLEKKKVSVKFGSVWEYKHHPPTGEHWQFQRRVFFEAVWPWHSLLFWISTRPLPLVANDVHSRHAPI